MGGFGFVEKKKMESKAIKFDAVIAQKLYDVLKSNSMLTRTTKAPSIDKWANEIRILRKAATESEIQSVLKWYIKNIKDEYTPKIYSAKKFRIEFHRLVEAMSRKGEPLITIEVEISPEAQRIWKRLEHLTWPAQEGAVLGVFIQVSLDNYNTFYKAIQTLFYKLKLESDKAARKRRLYNSKDWADTKVVQTLIDTMPPASAIIEEYLKSAHFVAWNYPNWKGDLHRYVFTPESNRFQIIMSRLLADYRGDGGDWPRIFKMISEFMPKDASGKAIADNK